MIIDLTGNCQLVEERHVIDDKDFDWGAWQDWKEYVNNANPDGWHRSNITRDQAAVIVEGALADNNMRDILARACSRSIRSQVVEIIRAFEGFKTSISEAAIAIVDLDRKFRKTIIIPAKFQNYDLGRENSK